MLRKRTPRCRNCCAGHEICPSRELDNIQSLQAAAKGCPCHGNVHPDAGNAAPAMKFASHLQSAAAVTQNAAPSRELDNIQSLQAATKCCPCHANVHPERLSRKTGPPAASPTTSNPFRQLPNAAHATQMYTQIQEMLRRPRILRAKSKCCACHAKQGP